MPISLAACLPVWVLHMFVLVCIWVHVATYDPIEVTDLHWVSSPTAMQHGFLVCFVLLRCLRQGLLLGLEVTDWIDWPVNPEIHLFPSPGPQHCGYSHEQQRPAKYIDDGNPHTSLAGILPTKLSPQSLVNILSSKWFWLLCKSHGYCRSYLLPLSINGKFYNEYISIQSKAKTFLSP